MQHMPTLFAACLQVPMEKTVARPRLLHVPCGDGTATAALGETFKLFTLGADPLQTEYVKATKRLNAAECATPGNIRIHPDQAIQILWCSPGTYPIAAALQNLAPTLQHDAILLLHLDQEQLTHAFTNWVLTQTDERQAFQLPGQANRETRLVLARYVPSTRRTTNTADSYLEALRGELPILTVELAPKYTVPIPNDDDTTPHLYSSYMELEELATFLDQSSLWQDPALLAELRPVVPPIPKPLLPTKPGHLALQIAAGLLNGHEITYKQRRLLIKGQTTKKITSFTDEELDAEGNPQIVTRQVESFATVIRALDLKNGTLYDIQ